MRIITQLTRLNAIVLICSFFVSQGRVDQSHLQLENAVVGDGGISLAVTEYLITLQTMSYVEPSEITLPCDPDMRTRPRFFSKIRNHREESRYQQ